MKKVWRVRCEVDDSLTIEKYDTYVFAHEVDEAERIACQYWEDRSRYNCARVVDIECLYEEEVLVIGTERVY